MEKKNNDLEPELVAYALMWSFSHASHQCGHDSSSPIGWRSRVTATLALFLRLPLSSCVVTKKLRQANVVKTLCSDLYHTHWHFYQQFLFQCWPSFRSAMSRPPCLWHTKVNSGRVSAHLKPYTMKGLKQRVTVNRMYRKEDRMAIWLSHYGKTLALLLW